MLAPLFLALVPQVAPAPATSKSSTQQKEAAPAPAAPPAPKERLLLTGALVHTMVRGEEARVTNVLIEDGHVKELTDARPSGVRALDLGGKHLVPGLIDAHVNFDAEHDALYLAAGVTLVRDVGGDHSLLLRQRAPELRDRLPGPALLSAGAVLDGDPPASALAVVLRSADSAEAYLPILFEEGVDYLSILPGLSEDAWKKTLALAHERHLMVFGSRPRAVALAAAVAAGQDGFHSIDSLLPPGVFWDTVQGPALDESVAALARAERPLVPLFHASSLRLEDQGEDGALQKLLALLGPSYESWWRTELAARKELLAPERRAAGTLVIDKQGRALKSLFDSGVRLLPGSGAPQPWLLPGQALHRELGDWVRAGLPPAAVLDLATRGAAEALGLAGQRGTIQPGAWADLLVLDGDPREDLAHLLDPLVVVVRGRPVTHAEIEQHLAELATRQAEVRAELARPVEVAPPPQGEEGVVVLEGTVESESYGSRVSTERYRVVQLSGDARLYTGRIVYPAAAGAAARELTVEQFVTAGKLAQVHVVLTEGGSELVHDALWTANTWRMQLRLDGRTISTPSPLRDQPLCVDVSSVTSLLILGQAALGASLPVVQLHTGFDAEPVNWRVELDDLGDHQIRTQLGQKAFRVDGTGALVFALSKIGPSLVRTRALSSSAFGGAGLPLPADKRARRAGSAPAPGSTPEAGAKSGG